MLYQMTKFQCHAFFLSLDIKQVVTLSSYLDNWWRMNFKIYFWSTKAVDKTETCLITYYITFNHSQKQWVTGKKEGKDANTKNWISQERKEFFRWNKKQIFHNYLWAIIWWKNEKKVDAAWVSASNTSFVFSIHKSGKTEGWIVLKIELSK